MERNNFSSYGRGSLTRHLCEIILKSGHWPRRCRLNVFKFLALAAILFSGEVPVLVLLFVAIMVEDHHPRNISMKLF